MKQHLFDYRLYLVTEEATPIDKLLEIVEKAILGGVKVVQLREKNSEGKLFYEKAIKLKQLLDQYSIPLIINDRVDIALAVKASGVHIGQADIPVQAVKEILPPEMIVGVSVSTREEALIAESNGADYLGVGSIFPTESKHDAKLLAQGMLGEIKNSVRIPIVAIGGIQLNNLTTIKKFNPDGYAVVSAIMKATDPKKAAMELLKKID